MDHRTAHRALTTAVLFAAVAGWLLLGHLEPARAAEPHAISVAFLATGTPCTEAAAKGPNTVTRIAADRANPVVLCAHLEDLETGTDAPARPVEFRVAVGTVGMSGTAKYSGPVFSTATGTAQVSYRGDGASHGTDTVIVTFDAGHAMATETIEVMPTAGGVASKLTVVDPSVRTIAAIDPSADGYASPTPGAGMAVHVQDWKGFGVNGLVMLVSVDRGTVVANPAFALDTSTACAGATGGAIVLTSNGSDRKTPGGTPEPGIGDFTVCAARGDDAGDILVTVDSISQPLPRATVTLRHAGRPTSVLPEVDGATVRAWVTDAAGRLAVDGTPIRFLIAPAAGAVSTACALTRHGAATTLVGLDRPEATVLITAEFNTSGTAASCVAPGTRQVHASAMVIASR